MRERNRELVEQFWQLMNTNDWQAVGALLHDEYVLEWPQSGERIRGRENFAALNAHHPAAGPWHFTVRYIVADADGAVSDVAVTDGVVRAHVVSFFEVRDDRIWRMIEYWPDRRVEIVEVQEHTPAFHDLLLIAGQLAQARYIAVQEDHIEESILLGAFVERRCAGFLRCIIQVIGRDRDRPPIQYAGHVLREGYVEAFGVVPAYRRQGVGQMMQERVIGLCRQRQCYQIRSRSPITGQENYALKLKMGYAIHPSAENDSYYFIKLLADIPTVG